MAESTAAAPAPSGGPVAKGSSSGAWWKSLTTKKKAKESLAAAPESPRLPLPAETSSEPPPFAPPSSWDSRENQQPSLGSGSGSRRNLKISRSGRFKEKRKVRSAVLAENPHKFFEGGAGTGTSPAPARPGEETRCQ